MQLPLAVRIRLTFLPENPQERSQGFGDDRYYPMLQTIVPLISVAQVEEDTSETLENSESVEETAPWSGR